MKVSEAFSSTDGVKYKQVRAVIYAEVAKRLISLGKSKKPGKDIRLADAIIAIQSRHKYDISWEQIQKEQVLLVKGWYLEDNNLFEQHPETIRFLHKLLCSNEKSTQ